MQFRVGLGQDSHRIKDFEQGAKNPKPLVLAGVIVAEDLTSSANSDGDVIAHALCNALSSACGGRSISFYADPMCEAGVIDSFEYIKEILKKEVRAKGFKVNNVSIAVEAGRPKLERFHDQMKANLAKVLDVDVDQIGITFTSGEKLTPFGKGEGIQVFCVVSLIKE
ncbi:MAG: 2-C-methyl-D-erythritol 2,4-cyclodiphosphate synthase [Patescibacteria group bacterium]